MLTSLIQKKSVSKFRIVFLTYRTTNQYILIILIESFRLELFWIVWVKHTYGTSTYHFLFQIYPSVRKTCNHLLIQFDSSDVSNAQKVIKKAFRNKTYIRL